MGLLGWSKNSPYWIHHWNQAAHDQMRTVQYQHIHLVLRFGLVAEYIGQNFAKVVVKGILTWLSEKAAHQRFQIGDWRKCFPTRSYHRKEWMSELAKFGDTGVCVHVHVYMNVFTLTLLFIWSSFLIREIVWKPIYSRFRGSLTGYWAG